MRDLRETPTADAADPLADERRALWQAAWERLAQGLRRDLGARTFDHWLKPVAVVDMCALTGTLTLGAPSDFLAHWVGDRFGERLHLAWRAHFPEVRAVRVVRARPSAAPAIASLAPPAAEAEPATPATVASVPLVPAIDARCRFERFVVARSNILAFNAAKRMVLPEAPPFSPLFLAGGTGQGKTHLLTAASIAFLEAHPTGSALYLSAERFMRDFVQALRAGEQLAFKDRLRGVDLLLVDDLQFIVGKGSTQVELMMTIDELMQQGRRVILAADRPPHALDGIDPRLASRLAGGLVADIEPPERGLREEILRVQVARLPGVDVPEDVIGFIADKVHRNIRELEGAMNKLVAYATLTGTPIDLPLAEQRLAEAVRGAERRITIEAIQKAVCAHFKLDRAAMASKERTRAIARPRQVAMYLAKELTPRSYPEIGRHFGGRDHTTVIHAVKAIGELTTRDHDLDAAVRAIRAELTR